MNIAKSKHVLIHHGLILATFALLAIAPQVWASQTVGSADRFNISQPLTQIQAPPVTASSSSQSEVVNHFRLNLATRAKTPAQGFDPLRQTLSGTSPSPLPLLSFEGVSNADNIAQTGSQPIPPDTEGDVGLLYYIQMNNKTFEIFDKATGATVFGPRPNNLLWAGLGGICETRNDGDPIVLYDHAAGRWLFSQFATEGSLGSDGHQCIAVSTTADPLGTYYQYDFIVSPGAFNDYPKIGLWHDAYYMSTNEFSHRDGTSQNPVQCLGAAAAAFQRDALLAGSPNAFFVKFGPLAPCDAPEYFFSMQPFHWEGPTPPMAGAPGLFVMSFDDEIWGTGNNPDGYRLWELDVNWTNPLLSTLTSLGQVDTTEFDGNFCNFSRDCIPQPNTSQGLHAIGHFTMYRAAYRNAGGHQALLVNHAVDLDGVNLAGIRWAELRNIGGSWFLHQTGTYGPDDGENRWMGSLAMDGDGNIALGYSVSSASTFPSVRYVTRRDGDPAGMMTGAEVELIAGGGSQTSNSNRWGDYSTMSIDPADDCTFWYTQEYYAATSERGWQTRIGAFRFADCGVSNQPPEPEDDFFVTEMDVPLIFSTQEALANDTDPDGDPVMPCGLGELSQPDNGTVTFVGVNPPHITYRYTPNPGFIGRDPFTYCVEDGQGGEATATITMTVIEPIFFDDFESADLSLWGSQITVGNGVISASNKAAIFGNYGLKADVAGVGDRAFVIDPTPSREPAYRADFAFGTNAIKMLEGSFHTIFTASDEVASQTVVAIRLRRSGGQLEVAAITSRNNGSWAWTPWAAIDKQARLAVEWRASSLGGELRFLVDGRLVGTLGSLDNDQLRIDQALLGAVFGIDNGTEGSLIFDQFESGRF